uniref:BRISC and BRCA1-A complex member 2 n=1 Tax=Anoplophora glabripennis TaxID=217634 RepID=V5H019_ANOGL
MTDYNTDNILCNYPACLRKNIEELCLRSQIGLGSVSLRDISILSNRYSSEEDILSNYHFMIKIPYAGKQLKWEVIFDPENFYFAPDFDFNDDQFLNNPDYEMIANNVPGMVDWNLKDPKALSQVLNEFVSLYKKLQIEKLIQDNIYSRYSEEYQMLVTEEQGIASENVEVCVDVKSIYFLISLKIDCSSLPEYIQPPENDHTIWNNPGEDYAHLKICILKLDGTHSNTTLQLSPRLEQVLGNSKALSLPEYKRELSLIEYVSKVAQMIDGRIELVANHFKMKKIYIASLAAACSRYIVEYDTETFNKTVLLYSVGDYCCLVTVTIVSPRKTLGSVNFDLLPRGKAMLREH